MFKMILPLLFWVMFLAIPIHTMGFLPLSRTIIVRPIQNRKPQQETQISAIKLPWFKGKDDNNKKDVWGGGGSDSSSSNGSVKASSSSSKGNNNNNQGLGGVAGIMDSMQNFKTAQQVGKMTNSLVQDFAAQQIEGTAVEGKVKVVFDGQQRPVSVAIDEAYLETVDASDLSQALTKAMKDAYRKSAERMDEKMKSFYLDLGLK